MNGWMIKNWKNGWMGNNLKGKFKNAIYAMNLCCTV